MSEANCHPRQILPPGCEPYKRFREPGTRRGQAELAALAVEIAAGVQWQPARYEELNRFGGNRRSYVRAFCSGGTAPAVRALGFELNEHQGSEQWGVRSVYDMLGCSGYPVTCIGGIYRLWVVNDAGLVVDARGHLILPQPQVVPFDNGSPSQEARDLVEELAGKRRGGQGRRVDVGLRLAIETRAMDLAISYFSDLGCECSDVTPERLPYDLLCYRHGEEFRVEVKGTTSGGQSVLLTPREVKHATTTTKQIALCVVSGIEATQTAEGTWIATGGAIRELNPWSLETSALEAVGYLYHLPDTTSES